MNGFSLIGWLIVIGAFVALVYLIARYVKQHPDQVANLKAKLAGYPSSSISTPSLGSSFPTDTIDPSDRVSQLNVVQARQLVTLVGDRERSVQAAFTLHEMSQKRSTAPWTKTGAKSRVLELAGGVWIFKVPSREGGKPQWLKVTEVQTTSLMSFYKGTETDPGPAKLFRQNKQSDPVPYTLPRNLMPGVTWEVVDIGAFTVEFDGEGKSDNFSAGDHLYFVTSQEKGGVRWMIFIDARKGEAVGPNGLYVGEPFVPSADVQDLL